MLFVGSKDMSVYQLDLSGKGKLSVVYEGHWNRVTYIYTIPSKDTLVTISESNIKVWDLTYDECIKNMNDHSGAVVYTDSFYKNKDKEIITVSSNFELKVWEYETGVVSIVQRLSESEEDDMDKPEKMTSIVACCAVS